jgi:hypothetical protein
MLFIDLLQKKKHSRVVGTRAPDNDPSNKQHAYPPFMS